MGQLHVGVSPEPAILNLQIPFLTHFTMTSSQFLICVQLLD